MRQKERESRFHLMGWALFLLCSFFFIADGVTAGDPLGIVGSVLFFLACIIFLIPFTWKRG